jgi:hypothetical protein
MQIEKGNAKGFGFFVLWSKCTIPLPIPLIVSDVMHHAVEEQHFEFEFHFAFGQSAPTCHCVLRSVPSSTHNKSSCTLSNWILEKTIVRRHKAMLKTYIVTWLTISPSLLPWPWRRVCEALFSSVYLSICTILPLNDHTTTTCLLHISSIK